MEKLRTLDIDLTQYVKYLISIALVMEIICLLVINSISVSGSKVYAPHLESDNTQSQGNLLEVVETPVPTPIIVEKIVTNEVELGSLDINDISLGVSTIKTKENIGDLDLSNTISVADILYKDQMTSGVTIQEISSDAQFLSWQNAPASYEEIILAKTVWGEANGLPDTELAAVIWCVLNRVDSPRYPNDIVSVCLQPSQFFGYVESFPVTDHILYLIRDVMYRWNLEKQGETNVGRVLPSNYLYFYGSGGHNHFYTGSGGGNWDWSLPSPY